MGISKVWQWIRDKKTNTIRKWRSTFLGFGTASTFEGGERCFASELDVPESSLKPIGGSCSALTIRPQSDRFPRREKKDYKKRRASEKLNGASEPLILKDDWEQDNIISDEPSPASDSFYSQSQGSYQNFDDIYGGSFLGLDDLNDPGPSFVAQDSDIYDEFDEDFRVGSWGSSKKDLLSNPPVSAMRRSSEYSNSGSESTKAKRKLRFNIPQVSLSSADDPSASTLLLAVEELREQLEKPYFLAVPQRECSSSSDENQMSEGSATALALGMAAAAASSSSEKSSPNVLTSMKTVDFSGLDDAVSGENAITVTPRRATTDVERRRQSLAQRRQSNVQLVQSVSGRRTSTTLIPLTMAQIHLVRSLWKQIYVSKGPTVIGQTIIHRLFFKLPKTKEQFRKCPLPRNFPNHDSFAKAHAKAMGEMIDRVVEELDNLESIAGQLERVGRIHARVMRGELSSKLWNSVAETFIDCTLEWGDKRCRSETVRKAWALIVAFIIERVKTGHLEERKQMLSMRSTIAALERTELTNSMQVS